MKSFLRPFSPTADSSYWRKDVHLAIRVNGLKSLPRHSVVKLSDGSPYVPQVLGYPKNPYCNIIVLKANGRKLVYALEKLGHLQRNFEL